MFPHHENPDRIYQRNLRRFAEICKIGQGNDEVGKLDGLVLASTPTTTAPSGLVTPLSKESYKDCGIIGRRACGEVRKIVQRRTGRAFAQKRIYFKVTPKNRKARVGEKRNRKEVDDDKIERRQRQMMNMLRSEFDLMVRFPHVSNIQAAFAL